MPILLTFTIKQKKTSIISQPPKKLQFHEETSEMNELSIISNLNFENQSSHNEEIRLPKEAWGERKAVNRQFGQISHSVSVNKSLKRPVKNSPKKFCGEEYDLRSILSE